MPICRTSSWVTERVRIFPLPFTRGEDQGEGLIRRPLVSLTKWRCTLALPKEREKLNQCWITRDGQELFPARHWAFPFAWGDG